MMARGAIDKITEEQYFSCFGNSTEKYFWIFLVHRGGGWIGGSRSALEGPDSAGAQLEVADGADEKSNAEGKNILPPELLSPTPFLRLVDLFLQASRGMK